jgi:hypothetical protein
MDKKQSVGIALFKVGFSRMFVMIILDLQFVALILSFQYRFFPGLHFGSWHILIPLFREPNNLMMRIVMNMVNKNKLCMVKSYCKEIATCEIIIVR